jgi:hypothetical protein
MKRKTQRKMHVLLSTPPCAQYPNKASLTW